MIDLPNTPDKAPDHVAAGVGQSWIHPRSMEPMLPTLNPAFGHRCGELISHASALRERLPKPTRVALAPILELVNCYYSNLIEGHHTYPDEVDAAMRAAKGDSLESDHATGLRSQASVLANEGVAHIETQRQLARQLEEPSWDPTTPSALADLHRWFIERLPTELRFAQSIRGTLRVPIIPGAFRNQRVTVGDHLPPEHDTIPEFLAAFHNSYRSHTTYSMESIARIAAAHHRFVWIHPFLDGNGRVARLMTDAMLERANLGGNGLWRLSRGFARSNAQYKRLLAAADEQRHHDTDGRGNLTQTGFDQWCVFVLDQSIDQIQFMSQLIAPSALRGRIIRWSERGHTPQEGLLIAEVMLRGSLTRGEATALLGYTERHSRRVIDGLVRQGLMTTIPHAPLTPAIPLHVAPSWFPDLFPTGVEERLRTDVREEST